MAAGWAGARLALGREDEQQAAVLVVGGKHVRLASAGWSPSASTRTSLPITRTPHSSVVSIGSSPFSKLQPEQLLHRPADGALVVEAGQLEAPFPQPITRASRVADEEGGVRVRVVVVEQLEQEAEPAALAAAGGVAGSRTSARPEVSRSPQLGQMKMGMIESD